MFGRRPRYDDTFGVRMDLGADRVDPMSMRPASQAGQLRVKAPLLVEQPGSIFGGFGKRETDPFAAIRDKPVTAPQVPEKSASVRPRTDQQTAEAAPGVQALKAGLHAGWRRMSPGQRIGLGVVAGWLLIGTGLWVPVLVIAAAYFSLRRRAG
ncbi:MAG: hypothetical protein C0421_03770 [Hyphomonas sp.]|uniref:hypothetical protein n=1 Tax=Hyphomonas sp. TaxID=87 RepID=UPI0025BD15C9|nr:hypothetical protein [Hyphomonas sp.]MBA4337944.1 hypothetical protein [Hyphomonas sp.]